MDRLLQVRMYFGVHQVNLFIGNVFFIQKQFLIQCTAVSLTKVAKTAWTLFVFLASSFNPIQKSVVKFEI